MSGATAECHEAVAMPHCWRPAGIYARRGQAAMRRLVVWRALAATLLLSVIKPSGADFADGDSNSGSFVDVSLQHGDSSLQRPQLLRREHQRSYHHRHQLDGVLSYDKEGAIGNMDQPGLIDTTELEIDERHQNLQASHPADWEMRTSGDNVWACAWEGGDCCCEGSVRLGKHTDSGTESWTAWMASDRWTSCEATVLGEPNAALEDKYCECHGYCPVFCNQPTYVPEHLNTTQYCAVESPSYSPGDYCQPMCEDGYYPTADYIYCRTARFGEHGYVWSPENFTCEGMPCAAPTWINNSGTPACIQGSHIIHHSDCSSACAPGYTPDISVLTCNLGVLTPPDFHCIALPCSAEVGMNPLNGHPEGPCKEGTLINSDEICTLQCQTGFRPTRDTLWCHLGSFEPAAFWCHEIPCAVPTTLHQAASPCEEEWPTSTSSSIPSNATCTPQCEPGYLSTVANMTCHQGELTPSSYVCEEAPCEPPENIANSSMPCQEGSLIHHDESCTAKCEPGFSPSVAALLCNRSRLIPPTFSCDPNPCETPSVINAQPNPCQGLSSHAILSGTNCTPVCNAGFTASVLSLFCSKGALTPQTFTCEEKGCGAPGSIPNAEAVSCKEGLQIRSGHGCTLNCANGYVPTSSSPMFCSHGQLKMPPNISCVEAPCQLPSDIQHVVTGACPGTSDWMLPSGQTCVPACQGQFIASEPELSCALGQLTPPTFECRTGSSCAVTAAIASNLPDGVNGVCWEGGTIGHGSNCTATCGSGTGFTPSVLSLQCNDGTLEPASFVCIENSVLNTSARCMAPANVKHSHMLKPCQEGIVFGEGETCTPNCRNQHHPTAAALTCTAGSWFPPTFRCVHNDEQDSSSDQDLGNFQNGHRQGSNYQNGNRQGADYQAGNQQGSDYQTRNHQGGTYEAGNHQGANYQAGHRHHENYDAGNGNYHNANHQTRNHHNGNNHEGSYQNGNQHTGHDVGSYQTGNHHGGNHAGGYQNGHQHTGHDVGSYQTGNHHSGNDAGGYQSGNQHTGHDVGSYQSGNHHTENDVEGYQSESHHSGNHAGSYQTRNAGSYQSGNHHHGNHTGSYPTGNQDTPNDVEDYQLKDHHHRNRAGSYHTGNHHTANHHITKHRPSRGDDYE